MHLDLEVEHQYAHHGGVGLNTNTIRLNYGKSQLAFELDPRLKVKMFVPKEIQRIDLGAELASAISHPVNSLPLADLARGRRDATICIPDRTRPRIARDLLPGIVETLVTSGIDASKITVLIANGSHSEHTRDDIIELVGQTLYGRVAIAENMSQRESDFLLIGKTTRGTPVYINRLVTEADLVVLVSSVTTHYFAGWCGGRKMILPGVAGLETIRANHRLTLTNGDLNEHCASGCLEANPVHEDMVEAASMLGNLFSVNVVLDGRGRPAAITAGDLQQSHLAAVSIAQELLRVEVPERCDLAIASPGGYPFDINFIQTHKSIDHVAKCIRDEGVTIVIAECSRGLGSETFLQWFEIGDRRAISAKLLESYELNGHTALALMKKLEHFRIVLVSSLPKPIVEKMGMVPASSIDEALQVAVELLGEAETTYVFPFAWGILPVG